MKQQYARARSFFVRWVVLRRKVRVSALAQFPPLRSQGRESERARDSSQRLFASSVLLSFHSGGIINSVSTLYDEKYQGGKSDARKGSQLISQPFYYTDEYSACRLVRIYPYVNVKTILKDILIL